MPLPEDTLSPQERETHSAFEKWANAHQRIKKPSGSTSGRDYVRHAQNLLPFLESMAEANPIAKAVVGIFRNVVMYEVERGENDARVAVLFLSQTDIMSTLLDVDKLAGPRRQRLEAEGEEEMHSDSSLQSILLRVGEEIENCANSMETYRKESRVVKFLKATQWKERMENHATAFDNYRHKIQQILSIQTASDVQSLRTLLSRLYTPKGWEKDATTKALERSKNLKGPEDLIHDPTYLQNLIAMSNDSSPPPSQVGKQAADAGIKSGLPNDIEKLQKELNTSLDKLCDKNREMFKVKLRYHAQQLQDTINNSARHIIKSLSGPYDRLYNEDLKILWKEMNWIFCVDNKHFASALYEYYLDHFSTKQKPPNSTATAADAENHNNIQPSTKNKAEATRTNTNVTGLVSNPDSWTLELISLYGSRITSSIDCDESGLIRISEVNAFTTRMPDGWSLPQWCAYAALGESYESLIYRQRIHNILECISEMHAKVLPLNRVAIMCCVPLFVPFFQLMAWKPTTSSDPSPPDDLRSRVHEKIHKQDDLWRKKLGEFKWTVDDSILQLIYGKRSLETYILPLSFLLLEYVYDVMQVCCSEILDVMQIFGSSDPLFLLQTTCLNHVRSLRVKFQKEKKPDNYLETFSGGIWSAINYSYPYWLGECDASEESDSGIVAPFKKSDIHAFFEDRFVLDAFPLRSLAVGQLPYLRYIPWKDHIRSNPQDKVHDGIPVSWNEMQDEEQDYGLREKLSKLPLTLRKCYKCENRLLEQYYYGCTECTDFDICSACWQRPAEEHTIRDHEYSHNMLRFVLETSSIQRDWLNVEAQFRLEEFVIFDLRKGTVSEIESSETEDDYHVGPNLVTSPFRCGVCSNNILHGDPLYKCMKNSCNGCYICDNCANDETVREDPNAHQWYHHLLVLRWDINTAVNTNEKAQNNSIVGDRISGVEAKLDTTDSVLQETSQSQAVETRLSRLEDKMDGIINQIKSFLESSGRRMEGHQSSSERSQAEDNSTTRCAEDFDEPNSSDQQFKEQKSSFQPSDDLESSRAPNAEIQECDSADQRSDDQESLQDPNAESQEFVLPDQRFDNQESSQDPDVESQEYDLPDQGFGYQESSQDPYAESQEYDSPDQGFGDQESSQDPYAESQEYNSPDRGFDNQEELSYEDEDD
ncbi:hypothetical protein BDN70DRAFT_162234 [Pholiota conissans]|uniref:ZZ-type domain-containing protein n=1 Tax=Pholiota conissans TaxID=109636 RepID=A0A9P5ZD30_9AGAR|nr:hypothetical protein BDN70DRAFT_162234 [Pholiota conissans]